MRKLIYVIMVIILVVFISNCTQQNLTETPKDETTTEASGDVTNVEVYLTDTPLAEIDKIVVDIPKVTYHFNINDESSDVTVNVATEVDLLSLAGTEVKFFDLNQIPNGATLSWIGMKIDDATAIVKEDESPIKVPENMIKVLMNTMISSDTEIVMDFDISRSLVRTQCHESKFAYILQPVINSFVRNKHMAKLHGKITDTDEKALDFALVTLTEEDASTPTRVVLTNKKGFYMMGGIEGGNYKLSVYTDYTLPSNESSLTLGEPATTISVELNAGDDKVINLRIESSDSSSTDESSSGKNKSDIKVYLTDTPLESLDNLIVDISKVTYRYGTAKESSDVTVNVATEVDLLSLAGTEIELFCMDNIPEDASITKITVEIDNATVVVNGSLYPIQVKGKQAEILVDQRVASNTNMLIDFDVANSLVKVNSVAYELKPVLKIYIRREDTAKIYGKITYKNGNDVKFALVTLALKGETSPVRITITNKKGTYMIGGINDGEYELSVYTDYTLPNDEGEFSFGKASTTTDISIEGNESKEVNLTIPLE